MQPLSTWKAIAAVSENGVIGNGAQIPWHLPEDFKWFKSQTLGQIVVMGRKTYASVGRPLPGRETILLSHQSLGELPNGVRQLTSLEALIALTTDRTVWICGGAEIYRQALPFCTELFITHVKRTVEGDIHFPEYLNRFKRIECLRETTDFDIVRYGVG
jgi:dihydrofolate reductase